MTKEEMKNKYSAFITEISEILGLGKPVDILKLCAITDLFFQPLEKRITELEQENAYLKRSRWHNLRKNPQDLPKEDGVFFVVDMDYGHPGYKVAMFWKKDGAFTGHYLAKLDVIAWREIPVFQEGA